MHFSRIKARMLARNATGAISKGGPVPLNDLSAWRRWVKGANWRHPEGPGSSIQGRENHPAGVFAEVPVSDRVEQKAKQAEAR
jgi:hypothetical protein